MEIWLHFSLVVVAIVGENVRISLNGKCFF